MGSCKPRSSDGPSSILAPLPESPWSLVGATLREPHFRAVWVSNLVHFSAWSAQFVMLQWLVTSLTDSRTGLGSVSFLMGAVVFATSPFAGVAADRLPRRNLLVLGRLGLVFTLVMLAPIGALFVGMLADATSDQIPLGIFGVVPTILLVGILTFGHQPLRAL